ncbi:ATP-NAD kinase family protein [Methanothrix thermoacetophila]|uniref:ATP-NAD/AcoX kinase n=1 Tax=Methanothrix thermoacetophila (strain DSM 6194 / JCM 14653 / NBRC 101360 / PT) TaxID=349307 RepID=A0B8N0_METTP|nr:ATP-NAD kinase family protein [Methanothrix thermoacetophila]ABK15054.1 ATP-NAD/AcoX kinase [Methanothrix thermoacetophila PT]
MPGCRRCKLGFLINPIAGMGGAVGLKGTDGVAALAERLGAAPVSKDRAERAFRRLLELSRGDIPAQLLTAGGPMGEGLLQELDVEHYVVHTPREKTTAEDTKRTCSVFASENVDLILFCGGDGTARDVASVSGDMPILGIPSGVKMHSGVFAVSPEAAADLAFGYIKGELRTRETEIADVDEEHYRKGELVVRLYGTARTPYLPALVQQRKQVYASSDEEHFKLEIAQFAREFMSDGSYYILGAGTTTAKIAELIGCEKTLLGVDVIRNGRTVLKDASESDLLELLGEIDGGVRIIVSPIGAQGFILGRGSQQISPRVLRIVGPEKLILIATPHKLRDLKYLLVDTGDVEIDRALAGRRQVVTGYRMAQLKEVRAASDVFKA